MQGRLRNVREIQATAFALARPQAVPVLIVANWNARAADMHREMIATRAVAQCQTMADLAEVALHYAHSPWPMRHFYKPELDQPAPVTMFQTYIQDENEGPSQMVGKMFAAKTQPHTPNPKF